MKSPAPFSFLLAATLYPDSDDPVDLSGDGSDELYDRVEFWYNRLGERIQMKDQNETVHIYAYDNLGRLISDQVDSFGDDVDTAVARIDRAYEVRGMLEKVTSYDNSQTPVARNQVVFEYNGLGLPSVEYQEHSGAKDGNSLSVAYGYDDTASGGELTLGMRPKWVDYPNGRRVHFTYGTSTSVAHYLNRLDAINADNGSGLPGDVLTQYTYLGLGTPVIEDFPEPQLKLDYFGGTSGTYAGLDRFGRVLDQRWIDYGPNPTVDAARIMHGYDRAGNRLYREDPVAAANSADLDELYAYDGMNHLVDFQRGDLTQDSTGQYAITSNARAEQWTLDPTGNWAAYKQDTDGDASWNLEQSRSHNNANELTQIDSVSTHVAHDPAGNMRQIPKPNDWSAHYDLTYDAWNRLVKVEDGENTLAEYAYDGQNRRTLKKVYVGGQLDETRHFFYSNQWQVLEERVDASTNADRQYVWGVRYVDELILRDRNVDADPETGNLGKTGSGLDERCYAMQDANWNVVAIADANGDVQERYVYSAYGRPEYRDGDFTFDASGTDHDWTALYTGRELDQETGLYCYRNRYYSAELGRFVSRDSIGYRAGVNLYEYVKNNPTKATDPSGLMIPPDALPCDAQAWTIANAACQAQTPPPNMQGPPKVRCGMKYSVDLFGGQFLETVYYDCAWKPKCMCSKAELSALNAAADAACDGPNRGRHCYPGMTRNEALENAGKFSACEAARNAVNQKCFSGGDPGHREAARNANKASANCMDIAEDAPLDGLA